MKKFLTSLLCVMMVVCFMPAMAWADGETGTEINAADSLAAAFNNAATGDTIKITSNVSDTTKVISFEDKEVTLDLNGHTVSLKSLQVTGNDACLKIVDRTVAAEPVVDENYNVSYTAGTLNVQTEVLASDGATIIMESGIVNSTNNIGLLAEGDKTGATSIASSVNVNGGYVTAQEFAISAQGKGATVNFKGGVAESRDNAAIAGNGTNNDTEKLGGTVINISGGTLIGRITTQGYVSCGVYHPQEGILNVSGGTIYSETGCGILMRGGELNMTGGTIIADGGNNLTGKVGASQVVVPTSGIIFDQACGYYDVPNVTVDVTGDASVSGSKEAISVIAAENNSDAAAEKIVVTGGTFSSDVALYLPSGMQASADNETGKYVIKATDNAEAQIGTAVYATLSDAIAKAKSDDVIELLKDVECNGQVLLPEGVTLDGKGYSISASETANIANGGFIQTATNADNVTIKNLTVNTNGKAKHGIQYYCVTGGKVDNVIVNGGYYTSIIVNGSEVEIRDCTLNPDTSETPGKGAYANIEYAMGRNVNTIPKITVTNVTGSSEKPLVYADEATISGVKTVASLSGDDAAVVKKINEEYLDGAKLTYIKDNEVVSPGTVTYTITFNANGGTVAPKSAVTNEAGKLAELPTPTYSGYTFKGWFTASTGGERVTANTEFIEPTTIYAHWTSNSSYVPTTPTVQKPVIEPNTDVTTSLSIDGTTLTIKANDGYEITDVTVNGVSKGAVTTLTGLKTGDKVVITTQKIETPDDNAALIEAVKNTKLVARSANAKAPSGKKAIKVYWFNKDGSELNFDGYEIYRSTKKSSGYGIKPIYTAKKTQYFNTSAKKGTRYYYKVRGYKMINGEKVYTSYSLKAIRTAK